MDQQEKERIAQEKYGKTFEELGTSEKRGVGGTFGGEKRQEQMAEQTGGDVHQAYSEMGRQGGQQTQGGTQKE